MTKIIISKFHYIDKNLFTTKDIDNNSNIIIIKEILGKRGGEKVIKK